MTLCYFVISCLFCDLCFLLCVACNFGGFLIAFCFDTFLFVLTWTIVCWYYLLCGFVYCLGTICVWVLILVVCLAFYLLLLFLGSLLIRLYYDLMLSIVVCLRLITIWIFWWFGCFDFTLLMGCFAMLFVLRLCLFVGYLDCEIVCSCLLILLIFWFWLCLVFCCCWVGLGFSFGLCFIA